MFFTCSHFRSGVAWTFFLGVIAIQASHLGWFSKIGVFPLALLLGFVARMICSIPQEQEAGIHFSAKQLLRIGLVLVGVRCNFYLIAHTGMRMVIVAASVVVLGMVFVTWLGNRVGLSKKFSLLLALDTSICGASAVSSAAPIIRAEKEEIALVIPLGSFLGTIGVFGMTALMHVLPMKPLSFGIFAGASLQEVAQVLATVAGFPASMESGLAMKFLRILFLVPIVLVLGSMSWRHHRENQDQSLQPSHPVCRERIYALVNALWFVVGFFIVGFIHTIIESRSSIALMASLDQWVLTVATFFMAMAMAGVGLQMRLEYLQKEGLRMFLVALVGWLFLMVTSAVEIYLLRF